MNVDKEIAAACRKEVELDLATTTVHPCSTYGVEGVKGYAETGDTSSEG